MRAGGNPPGWRLVLRDPAVERNVKVWSLYARCAPAGEIKVAAVLTIDYEIGTGKRRAQMQRPR